jgi:hypothetical protein
MAFAASLTESCSRDTYPRTLQTQWNDMHACFAGPGELSNTQVNHLWMGVTFIMTHRAARALEWMVPEVELACRQQLAYLTTYRASVASVIARVSSAYSGGDVARSVNRAYLLFFLPFWSCSAAHSPWTILKRRPRPCCFPHPSPGVQAASSPPATAGAGPRASAPALPRAARPPLAAAAALLLPPGPCSGPRPVHPASPSRRVPDAAPDPPPRPAPAPGGRTTGTQPGFSCKVLSPLICGQNFGTNLRYCSCAVARAFPGRLHYPFECPIRYYSHHGRCPGWTHTGTRVPGAWAGDDITAATQAEWRTFQPTLLSADVAGATEVTF